MKKLVYAFALLAFAGCSSYSEIARWNSTTSLKEGDKVGKFSRSAELKDANNTTRA